MPTTEPTYGWTLPEDTDPLQDGAAAMRAMAGGIAGTVAAEVGVAAYKGTPRRCAVVIIHDTYPGTSSPGNRSLDLTPYGFTEAPTVVGLVPLFNNTSGGQVIANRAIGGNSSTELTYQLADVGGGASSGSDVNLHITLIGPVD